MIVHSVSYQDAGKRFFRYFWPAWIVPACVVGGTMIAGLDNYGGRDVYVVGRARAGALGAAGADIDPRPPRKPFL